MSDAKDLPAECCAKCRFGGRVGDRAAGTGDLEAVKDDRMVCNRYPPQLTYLFIGLNNKGQPVIDSRGGNPVMQPQQWCGEFQPVRGPLLQH